MRIVGGALRGRPLTAPAGPATRPTSDRARQAIFNILAHRFGSPREQTRVLDAFAGAGAMGIEALSRGAAQAVFLDRDAAAIAAIVKNLAALGLAGRGRASRRNALEAGAAPFAADLAFLDPPYGGGLAAPALEALAARGWLGPDALCVVEIGRGETLPPPPGFASADEDRVYGAARVVILRRAP